MVYRYVEDSFSFSVYAKDKTWSNEEILFEADCKGYIVVCGINCLLCNENNSYQCLECETNYAVKEDDLNNCYDIGTTIPNYYYDPQGNIFRKCPEQCKLCSYPSVGNPQYMCDECSPNFPYYFKQNDKNECKKTCNPNYIVEFSYECTHTCALPSHIYGDNTNCVTDCSTTSLPYLDVASNKCLDKCPDNIYTIETQKKCVSSCSQEGLLVLESSNKKECVEKCPTGYKLEIKNSQTYCVSSCQAPLFYNPLTNYCVTSCPSGMVYAESDRICRDSCPVSEKFLYGNTNICVQDCQTGTNDPTKNNFPFPEVSTNTCVDKCPSNYFKIPGIDKCYLSCPIDYPLQIKGQNICIDKCNEPTPFYDREGGSCIDDCSNFSPPKVRYEFECLNKCPENMILDKNNMCIKNLYLQEKDDILEIIIPLTQTVDWVNQNVIDYSDQNKTILGEGFIMQVYFSNGPLFDYEPVSEVDVNQCEKILKQEYKIPENEPLIIVKYDIINPSFITNKVEYSIYDKNGNKLDMSFCNEVTTEILYPINENIDINWEKAVKMNFHGIDIYNAEDTYFHSLCTTYIKNGLNVLSERRKNDYTKVSFCKNNCEYKGIDYLSKKVKCACFEKDIMIHGPVDNFDSDKILPSALIIMKCYQIYKTPIVLVINIGFWVCLTFLIFQITFILILKLRDQKKLISNLVFGNKACPSNKEKNVLLDYIIQKENMTEDNPIVENSKNYFDEKAERINQSNCKMTVQEKKESLTPPNSKTIEEEKDNKYLIESIQLKNSSVYDNMSYFLAIDRDKKNFISIAWELVKENHLLLQPFLSKNLFISLGINFSIFVLFLSFCFFFNGLLYTDSLITKNYKKSSGYLAGSNFPKCLLSSILSLIVFKFLKWCNNFSKYLNELFIDIKETDLSKIKIFRFWRRIIFYFIFAFLIITFFLYYLSIFCEIFRCIQNSWVIDGIMSCIIILLIDIILCFILSLLRIIGLKYKSKNIYNIELYLKQFYYK